MDDTIKDGLNTSFDYLYEKEKYDNYKLLRIACEYENYYVADKLCEYIDEKLEMDFILDPIDWILEEGEFTTLMYFAKYNWFQIIKRLKGKLSTEYINLREFQEGKTALFIATENGYHSTVNCLIDIGANREMGLAYDERRWEELRDEIMGKLPTHYEELSEYEQKLYYSYLEQYYEDEIESGNLDVRTYVTELSNLSQEFFDVYVADHIVSDVTPAMVACTFKYFEVLKLLWDDQKTKYHRDSNDVDILDYALYSDTPEIVEFVFKKLAPYKKVEFTEELCSICQYTNSNVKTVCNHLYCEECILKWLAIKQNCPMCRKQFYKR